MTTSFNFKRIICGGFKLLKIASGSRAFTCSTALLAISTFPFPSASADAAVINSVGVSLLSSVLGHAEDRYDGVIVEASTLPDSKDVFLSDLLYSLQQWKSSGKRGVWLKIPSDKLDYASAAVESGFVMHHAEKDYLMLTHWLSEDENKLPPNASHQIGVGCIVVNDEGKLLVVQEKNGPLRGTGIWKIPTGLLDAKEDIHLASCREVLEETGIETEFVGLLAFRHAHNFQFGKSDLFFVCLLKPLTTNIVKQESEIADCEWLTLEKYMSQEYLFASPVYSKLNYFIERIVKDKDPKYYLERHTLPLGARPGTNTLYLPLEPSGSTDTTLD